jgi:alpha 1,2-mannosyltransferase
MKISMVAAKTQQRIKLLVILICLFFVSILLHHYSLFPADLSLLSSRPQPILSGMLRSTSGTGSIVEPSVEMIKFWERLHDALTRTKPRAGEINVVDQAKGLGVDPDVAKDYRRPEFVQMSEDDVDALRRAHADFLALARQMTSSLPFRRRSRGIVMTAGDSYVGIAITSLMMLRQTGTKLPVQLFVNNPTDQDRVDCASMVRALGAECVSMEGLWKATPLMARLEKYQYKVLSIISSGFQHVLFLDADCWPLKDPNRLFDTQPYSSHGLVTWQDFWYSTVSPHFYDIAQLAPSVSDRKRTSESGVMLYDKARHASSLLLAAYYNYYGPKYYYRLLSQGGHGEGDKETFLHSALVMGNPFYEVHTCVGRLGRWINGSFEEVGMRQADPQADFEVATAHQEAHPPAEDGNDIDVKPKQLGAVVQAPWMFIHQNHVKLDIRRISDLLEVLTRRDAAFGLQRLWGDDKALREAVGYDSEKMLWSAIIEMNCGTSMLDTCIQIRKWFDTVFRDAGME